MLSLTAITCVFLLLQFIAVNEYKIKKAKQKCDKLDFINI